MLKEFVWKTFEKSGSIDFYVFYKEIEGKDRETDKITNIDGKLVASEK